MRSILNKHFFLEIKTTHERLNPAHGSGFLKRNRYLNIITKIMKKETNEVAAVNNDWRLQKIEIHFERGYDFNTKPEEKVDRYEGQIEFQNADNELFRFKVKPGMAQKYIDLIAFDIVTTATGLGERLKESLGLK